MMASLRIAILGDHRVGKSAVTVRFLTRRFIGEYSSDVDLIYRSSLRLEDVHMDIEILDTCARTGAVTRVDDPRHSWADAFVVVYSVLNRPSFHMAKSLLESVTKIRTNACLPLMLLGNMTDLDHRREVSLEEGHQVALEFGCQHFEVSAAENLAGITSAFQSFLKEARLNQHQKNALMKRRRSSLAIVSRRLGAMFGKRESSGSSVGNPESPGPRRASFDVRDSTRT